VLAFTSVSIDERKRERREMPHFYHLGEEGKLTRGLWLAGLLLLSPLLVESSIGIIDIEKDLDDHVCG
jgi:hypothetical protein